MEKITLQIFENECINVEKSYEVRGGSGDETSTRGDTTICSSSDHDNNGTDSDY